MKYLSTVFAVLLLFFYSCNQSDGNKKLYIKSLNLNKDKRMDWYFFSLLSNFSRSYLKLNNINGKDITFFESFYISDIANSGDTLKIQLYKNDFKFDESKLKNTGIQISIDTSGGIWNQAASRLGRLKGKGVNVLQPHFQESYCPKGECY